MMLADGYGRILERMVRRLATLTLTLVLAAAPSALAACELLCASRDQEAVASGAGHAHHACHEPSDAVTLSIGAGVHNCGHADGLPASSAKQPTQDAPLPAVASFVTMIAVRGPGFSVEPRFGVSPPSDTSGLITQLRI